MQRYYFWLAFLRDWVISASAPWMTAQKPAYSQVKTLERTPFAESLERIFGTSRCEPASGWLIRGYTDLVELYQHYERKYRDFLHDIPDFSKPVGCVLSFRHYLGF